MAERRAIAEPAQTVVKVGSDYYVLASSLASRATGRSATGTFVEFVTVRGQPPAAADTVSKIMLFQMRFIREFRAFCPNQAI